MEPAVYVALLWLVFAATHLGLATAPLRSRLVARLGEPGFTLLFSIVASVSVALLVSYYAGHRFEGAAGLSLGASPVLRWILIALLAVGVVLMASSFASYGRSPYAVLGHHPLPSARGFERITRHPFFAGLAVFSVSHSLLATRLVGAVFLAGFAVVAIVGAWHQDQKLRSRLGVPFEAYLRETSAVPFLAILSGRQRLVWHELPFRPIAIGLVLTVVLRAVHDGIFAWGGALFVVSLVGSAAAITASTLRKSRPGSGLSGTTALRKDLSPRSLGGRS